MKKKTPREVMGSIEHHLSTLSKVLSTGLIIQAEPAPVLFGVDDVEMDITLDSGQVFRVYVAEMPS